METGATIGRFTLGEPLGEGATAIVFRAADGVEQVALKLLRPELALDPERRARFLREARVAREVQGRHLVPVLETGEADGLPFLALPLYPRSLAAVLAAGPLGPERVAAVVADVAAALDALRAGGLVHRDVKPSNILLDAEGRAQLADFGLATARDWTRLTRDGALVGTPHYVAPELVAGADATPASDLYSLGCVAYHCLVGRPPFGGRSLLEVGFAHLAEEPPPTGLPAPLEEACLAALAKEPADRPTTATAYAFLLRTGARSGPGSSTAGS
jgi:serine/threonine-protein kinase